MHASGWLLQGRGREGGELGPVKHTVTRNADSGAHSDIADQCVRGEAGLVYCLKPPSAAVQAVPCLLRVHAPIHPAVLLRPSSIYPNLPSSMPPSRP